MPALVIEFSINTVVFEYFFSLLRNAWQTLRLNEPIKIVNTINCSKVKLLYVVVLF